MRRTDLEAPALPIAAQVDDAVVGLPSAGSRCLAQPVLVEVAMSDRPRLKSDVMGASAAVLINVYGFRDYFIPILRHYAREEDVPRMPNRKWYEAWLTKVVAPRVPMERSGARAIHEFVESEVRKLCLSLRPEPACVNARGGR